MKKSKIIIPALGMLLLSTAASVTGTVAWFSSMQTGQAQITSFAVTKTGGSLGVTYVAGVGTELTGTNPNYTGVALKGHSTEATTDDVKLTHGSVNHATGNAYIPDDSLTTFTPTAEPTTGNGYQWSVDGTSTKAGTVYYAVSWTINFNYTFSADTKDVYLYFDGSVASQSLTPAPSSSFSHSTVESGTDATKETYKGFRLAMLGTNIHPIVWAPGTSETADEKYQNNAEAGNTQGTYTRNAYLAAGNLIDAAGFAHCKSGTLPANPTERADYLGTFHYTAADASTKVCTLAVKCIAWFEGNDSNVVDEANLDQVTATMGFYTRIAAAA
jgi:hypothetical protein